MIGKVLPCWCPGTKEKHGKHATATTDPASDMAKAPKCSPEHNLGKYFSFCFTVPFLKWKINKRGTPLKANDDRKVTTLCKAVKEMLLENKIAS